MTIFRISNKIHEEAYALTVVTAAAAGLYDVLQNLNKAGRLLSVVGQIVDMGAAPINASIVGIVKSLPLPAVGFAYGLFGTQLDIFLSQPDAVARNIVVWISVVVED